MEKRRQGGVKRAKEKKKLCRKSTEIKECIHHLSKNTRTRTDNNGMEMAYRNLNKNITSAAAAASHTLNYMRGIYLAEYFLQSSHSKHNKQINQMT